LELLLKFISQDFELRLLEDGFLENAFLFIKDGLTQSKEGGLMRYKKIKTPPGIRLCEKIHWRDIVGHMQRIVRPGLKMSELLKAEDEERYKNSDWDGDPPGGKIAGAEILEWMLNGLAKMDPHMGSKDQLRALLIRRKGGLDVDGFFIVRAEHLYSFLRGRKD